MLKDKKFLRFYAVSLLITAVLTFYPVYMGVSVMSDMLEKGFVLVKDYPKYIIPYTPISIAVILGVGLMPVVLRIKRYPKLLVCAVALMVFFLVESYMETEVIVKSFEYSDTEVQLEGWQLGLCIVNPGALQVEVWEAVELLLGGYDPYFKLHFYAISIVLIITVLNCFYGFGKMLLTGDTSRRKQLIIQTASTAAFLGMCIWACFTAFYRDGSIHVSPVSAVLMALFFIMFGTIMGLSLGYQFTGFSKLYCVYMPSILASALTLLMYAGEMLLLDGRLYRFGKGFFFEGLGALVFAPVDFLVILLSGVICAAVLSHSGRVKGDIS